MDNEKGVNPDVPAICAGLKARRCDGEAVMSVPTR